MSVSQLRLISILSLIMLAFLAIASVFGAFVDITYTRETASMAAQGMLIMTRIKGISEDMSIAIIFLILSLVSIAFLWAFLRALKTSEK